MTFDETDIENILRRARVLPEGPSQVSMFEEAVRAADVMADPSWQFYTRQELIRASFCAGEPDTLFVSLSWCLARCDQEPEAVNWQVLLWQCKHVLSFSTYFPDMTREIIADLTSEILARYRSHQASLRGPYSFMAINQLAMGSVDEATEYRQKWKQHPVDLYTESQDWEDYFEALYQMHCDNDQTALDIAEPYLNNPLEDTFPWWVYMFTPQLFKRGEHQRLAEMHRAAYRVCAKNSKFLCDVASHMRLHAVTGNFDHAFTLLERHFDWRIKCKVPFDRMWFDLHAWRVMEQSIQNHNEMLTLKLPQAFEGYQPNGKYQAQELAQLFESQMRNVEAQFNERNGNESMSDRINESIELDDYAVKFEIERFE